MNSPVHDGARPADVNRLTVGQRRADTGPVPEKKGNGFSSSIRQRRTDGAMPFFFVRTCLRAPSMSGGGGEAARLAGFLCHRSANPAICRSPRLAAGSGLTTDKEAIMPSTITSVQSQSETIKAPRPLPPYRYGGGDLALTDSSEPWIYIIDQAGCKWLTHSVEQVLRDVDQFAAGRDREQLLAAAAKHYGLNVWALIRGYGEGERRND